VETPRASANRTAISADSFNAPVSISPTRIEALAEVDEAAAVIVDVQNTIANNVIIRWGNDEQKRRYLPKLARDMVAAFGLSEAGAG
jgi:alkylation response protein AidB-like acyl-CoA dehydrogenase